MAFLYNVTFYASYFFVLIIFLILAIIFAKKLHAWIWYSIGSIITFISLIGNQKSYNDQGYFAEEIMEPYWSIYFALLVISAIIILIRYHNRKDKNDSISEIEISSKDNGSETGQHAFTCEMCDHGCDEVTYAKITDNMGTRYRKLCPVCMEIYNATPVDNK